MKCKGTCGRELVEQEQWETIPRADRDHATHARLLARGLCSWCHRRATLNGTLIDYPRQMVPVMDAMAEWVELADPEATIAENARRLAPRMGMTPTALHRAYFRAKARGWAAA